jgi:hypothetical protein
MRINFGKIQKILERFWIAPKRIFETFCTQEPLDASAWMQHSQLFIWFRKSNNDLSYTIFSVKKINVGKNLKLWENRYLIILSIHILKLEISGCDIASGVALLSLVGLRGLIPAPCLLVVLHWGVWRVPLWASIGIMTKLSALEASSGGRIRRCHRPRRCANCSSLLTLLGSWVWSLRDRTLNLLSRLLEMLSRMLGLLLPKVCTRSPKAERGVRRWIEARARHTPKLPRAGGLPLLLSELLTLVLQADGSIT